MISLNPDSLSAVLKFMVEGGYTGDDFAQSVKKMTGAESEVIKRNELHRFVVLPKRWIAERSFGWLEKSRRLWKNCERKLHTSLQMTVLAFISIPLRHFPLAIKASKCCKISVFCRKVIKQALNQTSPRSSTRDRWNENESRPLPAAYQSKR